MGYPPGWSLTVTNGTLQIDLTERQDDLCSVSLDALNLGNQDCEINKTGVP